MWGWLKPTLLHTVIHTGQQNHAESSICSVVPRVQMYAFSSWLWQQTPPLISRDTFLPPPFSARCEFVIRPLSQRPSSSHSTRSDSRATEVGTFDVTSVHWKSTLLLSSSVVLYVHKNLAWLLETGDSPLRNFNFTVKLMLSLLYDALLINRFQGDEALPYSTIDLVAN